MSAGAGVPLEAPWDRCWLGGDAYDLGLLSPRLLDLVIIESSIDWFSVGELYTYDRSDSDCYVFFLPAEGWVRAELSWDNQETDLDLVITAPWMGKDGTSWPPTREIFALAQGGNSGEPPPLSVRTSATFGAGTPVFIWIVGYRGRPLSYQLRLWGEPPEGSSS